MDSVDNWIERWCFNNEDPILLENFSTFPELIKVRIVSILDDNVTGYRVFRGRGQPRRGHCYLVDSIFGYVANNRNAQNPLTGRRFTQRQRIRLYQIHAFEYLSLEMGPFVLPPEPDRTLYLHATRRVNRLMRQFTSTASYQRIMDAASSQVFARSLYILDQFLDHHQPGWRNMA